MKKENEKIENSLQTAAAEESENLEFSKNLDGKSEDLISLTKFKDVSSLVKAYGSLESEFTKRCQKLKELEKENLELKAKLEEKAEAPLQDSQEQALTKSVDEFFENHPNAYCHKEILTKDFGYLGDLETLVLAYIKFLEDKAFSEKLIGKDELLSQIEGTTIKDDIIRSYLSTYLDGQNAKFVGGGEIVLYPPDRPKTMQEANALAKKIIKIR